MKTVGIKDTPGFRTKHLSILLGALVLLTAWEASAANRGVLNCSECTVTVPNPDEATYRVLSRERERLSPSSGTVWQVANRMKPGDTLTVCNGIVCADYTLRYNQVFDSGTVVSTVLPPTSSVGGGGCVGGGGGGGGGSGPISGGCHGNCGGGRVDVGELEQL